MGTVSAALADGTSWDAVHLLVHGSDRAIRFGGEWLLFDGANSAQSLGDWRSGLHAGADLLFYSCDTAETATGRDWLAQAFSKRGNFQPTDEAQLLEQAGFPVEVVTGLASNFKITTQDDFDLARAFLAASSR